MNRPFFDTSILVAGLIDFGESSRGPIELLDRVADGRIARAATAWHCCLEFYSVATRLPEEYRLPVETARQFVEEEIIGRLQIELIDQNGRSCFFTQAARDGIRGGGVYDYHIGRTALAHSASVIVTENKRHFSDFAGQGLPVLNSTEYIEALA